MRVTNAITSYFRLPIAQPWSDANRPVTHLELITVDMETDAGVTGVGFTMTYGVGGKAVQALLESVLVPELLGRDVNPRLNWRQLWMSVHDAGGAGLSTIALGALDIGQWDLLAKQAGVPLVDYLGRVRERAPAYRCGINLHFGPEELQAQVAEWRARGYNAFKIKVGRAELEEDIARVAAAREAAGKGLLLIDANQGWDIPTAARALRALERFDIFWIEEPLLADDIASHAHLRRLVDIPIAIGENVFTQFQFKDYLVSRACDYVQADVCRVGGITPFLEIAHVAEVWGAPLSPSFMIELGGQMMCCVRNINFVEDIDGGSLTDLGVLETDLNVRGGYFEPPEVPGHGVVFNRKAMQAHRG